MKTVEYKNPQGRLFKVIVPDDATTEKYQYGIVVGPPLELVDDLGLPEPIATRFHNALYIRGLYDYLSVVKRKQDLFGAWQSALNIDTETILEAFKKEYSNGRRPDKK